MPQITIRTTARDYSICAEEGDTLLEIFRKNNIPTMSGILIDEAGKFVSISKILSHRDEFFLYSMRNVDFMSINPGYSIIKDPEAITESFVSLHNPNNLALVQLNRNSALDTIYKSVQAVLDQYIVLHPVHVREHGIQFAFSPGGDGRALAEALRRYLDTHLDLHIYCVTVAIGVEDEEEHLSNAIRIAEQFDLDNTTISAREAADLLGYAPDLNRMAAEFKNRFPQDEPEVMLTYWVQEINFLIAKKSQRRGIIFGFNQEDIIADKLYQSLTGTFLPPFPIRVLDDFDIIAPLHHVPKKIIDSIDLENSIRNYGIRSPSISYLRSSLYFLSYMILEHFPDLADILSGAPLASTDPDAIKNWLDQSRPKR
ncbi:MAG: hypothetical protein HQL64_08915 [Magnetococcales bacterium]|nr:hypothetical protein [Magnetococcales bacterium]